jgi:hypothetical protein
MKTRFKVGLIPNPNCETRKTRKKNDECKIRIQQDLIIIMKQEHDKVIWQENISKTYVE